MQVCTKSIPTSEALATLDSHHPGLPASDFDKNVTKTGLCLLGAFGASNTADNTATLHAVLVVPRGRTSKGLKRQFKR